MANSFISAVLSKAIELCQIGRGGWNCFSNSHDIAARGCTCRFGRTVLISSEIDVQFNNTVCRLLNGKHQNLNSSHTHLAIIRHRFIVLVIDFQRQALDPLLAVIQTVQSVRSTCNNRRSRCLSRHVTAHNFWSSFDELNNIMLHNRVAKR